MTCHHHPDKVYKKLKFCQPASFVLYLHSMKFYFVVGLFALALFAVPNSVRAVEGDADDDGLTDIQETSLYFTDPHNPDTDGDSYWDGNEIANNYSPLAGKRATVWNTDTDGDKLVDGLEVAFKTSLKSTDTDADEVNDYEEVMHATNPIVFGTSTVKLSRRLEADLTTQSMKYIVDNKLVRTFLVSSGNPQTPTPVGEFEIFQKVPVMRYRGADYDLPNVHWNMQFKQGGYFLHEAYWHNNFGKKTNSHGCLNMKLEDAALIYKYLDVGTKVVVVGKTPSRRIVGT